MRLYSDELIDKFTNATRPLKINEKQILSYLNIAQDAIAKRIGFNIERKRTLQGVANQELYDLPSKLRKAITIRYKDDVVWGVSMENIERLSMSDRYTTGDSDYAYIRGKKLGLYEVPAGSAATAALTAAMTASSTSFTAETSVDAGTNVSNFLVRGTVKIDDEKIEYTGITNNTTYSTFSGLTRGSEGTVAASHSDEATITMQDIEIVGYFEPSNFINKPWGGKGAVSAGGSVDAGVHYYYLTFYSSSLDMESLPFEMGYYTTETTNLKIAFTGLSISRDPDVDYKRIYRTKAGAEVYYYVTQISNITVSANDTIADSELTILQVYPYSELMEEYHELVVDYALMEFFRRNGVPERMAFHQARVVQELDDAKHEEADKRTMIYSQRPKFDKWNYMDYGNYGGRYL